MNPQLAAQVSPNSKLKATQVTEHSGRRLTWLCEKGHEWTAPVINRTYGRCCPSCAKALTTSKGEREMADFIESLLPASISIVRNDRSVIAPYELDVYIPQLGLAFEFNGAYWHSDAVVAKNKKFSSAREYHAHKQNQVKRHNVHLIFVRESDWRLHEPEAKIRIQATLMKAAPEPHVGGVNHGK